MSISLLSTLHRALVTLSALHMGHGPRALILARNQVTEADLNHYYLQWQRLQVVHQAQQARYEPATDASPAAAASTGNRGVSS
ncbi:MAG: hypothetical protein EOO56_27635 [Hymenobacter sp.]|nr:MAG: hypothetical protein EOO56_27635 [Hymenobacter sp.]